MSLRPLQCATRCCILGRMRITRIHGQRFVHSNKTSTKSHPEQPTKQPQSNHNSTTQSSNQSATQANNQSATQSNNQSHNQTSNQTTSQSNVPINQSQAEAMHKRGIEWFTGHFGRIDYSASYVWFSQAAQADYAPSVNRLALMHFLGYGCDKDLDKAMELFRKAATLGDIDAANHLAALLQSNAMNPKSTKQSDKQSNSDKMRDAADLFEQAARGGHSRAALSLAKLILVGNSRPLAYDQALIWLEQAAEAQLSEAAYLAGLMHLHRPPHAPSLNKSINKSASAVLEHVHASRFQLVPLNIERGFELLKQAAELGSSDAHCDLGDWHLAGHAPLSSSDPKTAAIHYRAAAEVGNAVGQARLGMMIAHGHGVKRDRNEALLWLTTSANANNNDAHLGLTYLTLTQPNLDDIDAKRFDDTGRRELTEKQKDFIRDALGKVSESIHSIPSSSPEVKSGILAVKRDPWLVVDAIQSIQKSAGQPWIKGHDTLMQHVPLTK